MGSSESYDIAIGFLYFQQDKDWSYDNWNYIYKHHLNTNTTNSRTCQKIKNNLVHFKCLK